jgi:hypothetical protein
VLLCYMMLSAVTRIARGFPNGAVRLHGVAFPIPCSIVLSSTSRESVGAPSVLCAIGATRGVRLVGEGRATREREKAREEQREGRGRQQQRGGATAEDRRGPRTTYKASPRAAEKAAPTPSSTTVAGRARGSQVAETHDEGSELGGMKAALSASEVYKKLTKQSKRGNDLHRSQELFSQLEKEVLGKYAPKADGSKKQPPVSAAVNAKFAAKAQAPPSSQRASTSQDTTPSVTSAGTRGRKKRAPAGAAGGTLKSAAATLDGDSDDTASDDAFADDDFEIDLSSLMAKKQPPKPSFSDASKERDRIVSSVISATGLDVTAAYEADVRRRQKPSDFQEIDISGGLTQAHMNSDSDAEVVDVVGEQPEEEVKSTGRRRARGRRRTWV